MTLEDFFTPIEMKDGLTAPARVKQLVNVMQKEKHNIVKNVGDATRQWSSVASTIVATKNKDCLDLFLKLDGYCYFDSWLKDAQKFGNETGDSFAEESITVLLGAIEKLHIDDQKLVASGILMTVKNLLNHNSSRIQDRARALFDSWKQNSDSNVVPLDVEKVAAVCKDRPNASANPISERERLECSSHDISPHEGSPKGSDNEEKNVDPARDEPSICSETVHPEGVEDKNIQTSDKVLERASMKDGPPDPVCPSDMLKLVSENNSILENPQTYQSEVTAGIGSCGSAVPKQGILEGQLDVANSNEYDDAKQIQQIRSCDKLGAVDTSVGSDSTNALESKVDPDVEKDVTKEEEEESSLEEFPSGDVRTDVSEGKSRMGDSKSPNPCRNILVSDDKGQIDECNTDSVLQHSSISDHKVGRSEDQSTYLSRIDESGVSEEPNEHGDTDEAENDLDFSRSAIDARNPDVIGRADVELDYGTVDPLEVARQVAIKVEREVDCREPSCSSERTSGGGIRLLGSPDTINGKNGRVIHGPSKDVRTGSNLSAAVGDGAFRSAENLTAEQENCILDMDASRVPVAAQTSESNSDKNICGFDLNEEVLPDEMDHQINPIAAPISVVFASRATAASVLPVAPLQFEGTLGWKGSAETSAFRRTLGWTAETSSFCPAACRISEGEKYLSASGSHNSLRQRQDYLDIDLNVAESEDDKIADLMLGKEIANSVHPYGETSVDAILERSNGLQLDLNSVSDGGDALSYWRKEGRLLPHRNGHHSPSHSSSSSMQHSLRNIDLNDQPPLFNDFSDPANFGKSSQYVRPSGRFRPDDSVISIMGARVEINQKEFVPQNIPLANCRISDHVVDASLTRTRSVLGLGSTLPYTHSTVYGYNGPSLGPTIPFSSAMYGLGGHIPYMMDSRGSPVVPQILGSASSALLPAFSQPPFIMSMTGAPSGSNGVVPLRHNFDLNSGMMMDGGNRDTGGLRQLFNSGQGRSIDEHIRANSQPTSSSGVGGKRKETDGGWEPYSFNYKHHQPPWK